MKKGYKYKLYCSKKNRKLHQIIDIASEAYNYSIACHKRYYRIFKKKIPLRLIQKHLARKRNRSPKWKLLGSQALQNITIRIDEAYKLFFKGLKAKRKASPPSFKSKHRYKSFTLTYQEGWKLDKNTLTIGRNKFKIILSRPIQGRIKTVTIKRNVLGEIFVYFSCDDVPEEAQNRTMTGKIAGFDFGLKTFLTSSEGELIKAPEPFKASLALIKRASMDLSKKVKGSNNRKKARLNLARRHEDVTNQRSDFHWKLARKLALTYDTLVFEDLDLQSMKKLWGRKVSDLGFCSFMQKLKWECQKLGSKLTLVDRYFPSSQLCSACGKRNHSLTLKEKSWDCVCGATLDRNLNAAYNILKEGTSSFGGRLC